MRKKRRTVVSVLTFVAFTVNSILPVGCVYADTTASVQGVSTQETILSREDAYLQNYSAQDIVATKAYVFGMPYDGTGNVTDADGDGKVDVLDVCYMKSNFKEKGNYYQLLAKLMSTKSAECSITSVTGEDYSNRVVVRTDQEYDFSKYGAVSILSDSNFKYVLQFDSVESTEYCLSDLQDREHVVYAELDETVSVPDYGEGAYEGDGSTGVASVSSVSSNSWGVSAIEADEYAEYVAENFDNCITVALVDTGVSKNDYLGSRLLSNGIDVVNGDDDPDDDCGHGTHVAGTIVDCTPNLNIDILPIKVFDSNGQGDNLQFAAGIDYAVEMGVDVINLSASCNGTSKDVDYSIERAIRSGITVVVAAGNDQLNTAQRSPSRLSDCIVVSAVDSNLDIASFSNYGNTVDVCAPGVKVKSCTPGGGYAYMDGTSMAAPHITAAAAMVKYSGVATTPADIESTIVSTCMDLGTSGYDVYYGNGIPKLSRLIKDTIEPSISLSRTSVETYVGDSVSLSAATNLSGLSVSWSSADPSVATVSGDGLVTTKAVGTTEVTASFTYEGKEYSASCSVTVKSVSVSLDETSKTLEQTDRFKLSAKTTPTNLTVNWSTSDSDVATVSDKGRVTAISPGKATITASVTYAGREYSDTCVVTVPLRPSVSLSQTSLETYVGDGVSMSAATNVSGSPITWSSSNPSVATVDSNGLVTAKTAGATKLTASYTYEGQTYSASCSVTVRNVSVSLDETSKTLDQTDSFTLSATTAPTNLTVNWSTSDSDVATVSSNGRVTAISPGTATITASVTYAGRKYSATCVVTVPLRPSISLSKTSLETYVGDGTSISAATNVKGATITWSSSNPSVATVDSNGLVTAKTAGTTKVTASFTYEGQTYSASCSVTVRNVSVSISRSTLFLYTGDTSTLTATTVPSGQTVSWSTSNSNVARVSGGTVTAVGTGKATITASFTCNGTTYSKTCSVTVNGPSISLNASSLSLYTGGTSTLTATTVPSGQTVSWTTSNSNVATVSGGKVTAVGAGKATVTARFQYQGYAYSETCDVTVTSPSVSLSASSLSLYTGGTSTLTATTVPSGQTVSWSTSDSSIATVSGGKVTAVGAGKATVTASFVYEGTTYSKTCSVTVTKPSVSLNVSSLSLYPGSTSTLTATTTPSGQAVSWSVSNSSVATVSGGKVTAVGVGTTKVTASFTYDGQTYSTTCTVTVKSVSISMSLPSLSLYTGDTSTLTATTVPSGQTVSWSTSDSSIATVSGGKVTAVGAGTAKVTASFTYYGYTYSATCTVTVKSVSISMSLPSLSLYTGDTSTLTATTVPSGQTVSWSTSNSNVARVSGGKVTAVGAGTATVTASFTYYGYTYSATCYVTVTKPSISLSAYSYNGFYNTSSNGFWLGDSATLTKSGKVPSGVTVYWKSSDTGVVTVDSTGKLTSVSGGSATITASFTYGGTVYSDSISVTVLTSNSVRLFSVSPTSGSNGSTVFTFTSKLGFSATKVTLQVCNSTKSVQSDGTYDYTTYTDELSMSKLDVCNWSYSTKLTGFSSGSYLVRCKAYNGSSYYTAYVTITIS